MKPIKLNLFQTLQNILFKTLENINTSEKNEASISELVIDCLQELGYEPMAYIGRGPTINCIAVEVMDLSELFSIGHGLTQIFHELEANDHGENEINPNSQYIFDKIGDVSWDQLGLQYVVYFPNLPWIETNSDD